MRLPNAEYAIVDDRKLLEYVLNPDHPVGRHHAALFERVLGVARTDAIVLRQALLAAAISAEATPGRPSPHGRKYETRFTMTGRAGSATVLAVWLVETGTDNPRLITCYVE
ncbi:MAG: DUF6883 domain-containing protein [Phycisphaerales bacterium]